MVAVVIEGSAALRDFTCIFTGIFTGIGRPFAVRLSRPLVESSSSTVVTERTRWQQPYCAITGSGGAAEVSRIQGELERSTLWDGPDQGSAYCAVSRGGRREISGWRA